MKKLVFLIILGLFMLPGIASAQGSSGLTAEQRDSIISLIESFGADAAVVDRVRSVLGGASSSAPEAEPQPDTSGTSALFSSDMEVGDSGPAVRRLQEFLNTDPATRVAEVGLGSSGNETQFYGSLTAEAVQKFQEKYGIAGPGNPGYGRVGPATRAQLNEVFGGDGSVPASSVAEPSPIASEVSPVFNQDLGRGDSGPDVKRLQQLLNEDPDTRIAESGIGSPGSETRFFGSLTERAVQEFQKKYNIAGPGDSAYGFVGPQTRATLEEVFGE